MFCTIVPLWNVFLLVLLESYVQQTFFFLPDTYIYTVHIIYPLILLQNNLMRHVPIPFFFFQIQTDSIRFELLWFDGDFPSLFLMILGRRSGQHLCRTGRLGRVTLKVGLKTEFLELGFARPPVNSY